MLVAAPLGDEMQQILGDPADVIVIGQGSGQRNLSPIDRHGQLSIKSGCGEPALDVFLAVGRIDSERIARRI
ncbi:Uncharacterised protein [Mycobacteroides abscessus subsp. massiliense]|nr:Uncharacterised protein [Mycobacteroides abscessus subsp. massiliense]